MSTEPGVTEGEEAAEIADETTNPWALAAAIANAARLVAEGHHLVQEPTDDELTQAEADIAVVRNALAAARRAKG